MASFRRALHGDIGVKFFNNTNIGRFLSVSIAGLIASLAIPPLDLTLAIFALSLPFYWLAMSASLRQSFLLGWGAGFGWFGFSFYWVNQSLITAGGSYIFLVPFTATSFPLGLGLFWGVAFCLAWLVTRNPYARVLMLVATLTLIEYARGILGGFPWNAAGIIFASHDISLASLAFFGLWGATLIAFLLAAAPALFMLGKKKRMAIGAITLAIIGLVILGGVYQLQKPSTSTAAEGMTVRLVQPNIAQREKWIRSRRDEHLDRLFNLSRASQAENLDLIIWPESAFAGALEEERDLVTEIIKTASDGTTPLITGTLRFENKTTLYNSMILARSDGSIVSIYDKNRLVPFGEFIPLRKYIPFIANSIALYDFFAGDKPEAMLVPLASRQNARILPIICYEVIFPSTLRHDFNALEADLIVNITNDGWFGNTIGPHQHLAQAQMRAAELGTPLVRVANTGISAAINNRGQITHSLAYNREGFEDAVIGGQVPTFYRRYGESVFFVLIFLVIGASLAIEVLTVKKAKR